MSERLSRRSALARAAAVPLAASVLPLANAGAATAGRTAARPTRVAFADLERTFDARLGVFALDTATGRTVRHRAGERFAFCSTSKALTCGLLLRDAPDLGKVLTYTQAQVVANSPITSKHVDTGMSLRDLCDAALRYSDNTAQNLVMRELGGPAAIQRDLRRPGDRMTHVDRYEVELNTAIPGDVRDTTTPNQIAIDLGRLFLGRVLPRGRRAILRDLMRRNTTGGALIRAGVPSTWTVADKTGGGEYGTRNDIAVLRPPRREPIVLAVLSTRPGPDDAYDDALVERATEVVVGRLR